jgi:hypothetical protein
MRSPCRDAFRVRDMRGMARRKAQSPYGSCLAARGRLAARQQALKHMRSSRPKAGSASLNRACSFAAISFRQRALLLSGPSRISSADRAISQLLAGAPSGPGGSSAAARVPSCETARGRRTSPRLRNASRERPLEGRGGCIISEVRETGTNGAQRYRFAAYLPLVGRAGVALL